MKGHLINTDQIKERGYINKDVHDSIVATTLTRVQDIQLLPILGTAFYNRLLTGLNDDDLNSDEQELLNDYISDFLITAVDHKICIHVHTEIRAKTVGNNNDTYMSSADERQMLKLEDDLRSDHDYYKIALINHLKDNKDKFSEYKNYICSNENVSPQQSTSSNDVIYFA